MPKTVLAVLVVIALVGPRAAAAQCVIDSDCYSFDQCHLNQHCDAGTCASTPRDCNDGDVCTDDSCDPNAPGGCVHTPHCGVSTACSNQVSCLRIQFPIGFPPHFVTIAQCHDAGPPNCDDGSVCTTDHCVEPAGCLHDPVPFDDGDVCTLDACDPVDGISHAPLPGCCNVDAGCATDRCILGRQCVGHACTGGTAVACDDGDPCTTDHCNAADGCVSRSIVGFDGLACICSRTTPASCMGVTVPGAVTKRVTKACTLIDTARTAPTPRARKLLGRVASLLARAKTAATRIGRKGSPDCAQALSGQMSDGQVRATGAQQSL